MKKYLASAFLAMILLAFSISPAFAAGGYSRVELSVGAPAYSAYNMFKNGTGYFVLDANAGSRAGLTYVNFISLESLSDLCTQANGYGLNCSLFYNYYDDAFYILVDDSALWGLDSTRGVIGNTDGYVLGAKDTSVDLTDTNELLDWIRRNTSGIASQVARIDQALTSEDGPFALWMSLLDTDLNLVNINLEQISLKVQSVVDYTNVIANGTVTLVEKMDELIEAVNGISISADGATINFDTLPITNKLDEVITAVNGISVNVESGTFDTLPITNKLDEVITAINGISINVEGGTVNFDTVPITDKLDEVIDALHDISVEGAFCDHTFVDSGQYTYRTILPMTKEFLLYASDADENGWYEFPYVELIPGEVYQVYYDGEIYQPIAFDNHNAGTIYQESIYIGNQVANDQTLTSSYPFSIRNQLQYPSNEYKTTIKPISKGKPDISIAQRVSLYHCSKCGAFEDGFDLLALIGTINNAASVVSHAVSKFSFEDNVEVDISELTTLLSDNHNALISNLDGFFEWVKEDSLIAPCEHSYMPVVMVEPSCDLPGVTKFTCEYCGTFRMEISEPLGHEWMDFTPPEALLENGSFIFDDASGIPVLWYPELTYVTPGEIYTVVYNGVEYVTQCRMAEYEGLTFPALGNVDAFMGTGDDGLPFVLGVHMYFNGTVIIDFAGATSAVVSVYTWRADYIEVPDYMQPLLVCSRCDSGHNLAGVMEFLDERLVPGSGSSIDVSPVVDKLTSIENALSNLGGDVNIENNTNIEVSEDNDNYNIFYVDDPDGGDDQSIVDLSGDALKVFGKLLNFLYQVGFKDALDGAGLGIGDLSDFYLDNAEGSADLWAS